MISNLKVTARKIASERGIAWHSGLDNKFWKMDKDVSNGSLKKEDAVRMAASELKIEKSYDKHMEELKRAIR